MTEREAGRPGRRAVVRAALGSAGAAGLAACAGTDEPTGPSTTTGSSTSTSTSTSSGPTSSSPTSSSPTSSSTTTTSGRRLAQPRGWKPREGEVEVWCKHTAVRQAVAALTVHDGRSPDVASALRPLTRQVEDMEQSVVEVVYPQYGGLTRDRRQASVMIVLDLIGIPEGSNDSTRTSMTVDVRMRRRDAWEVAEVVLPSARRYRGTAPEGVGPLLRSKRLDIPREARLDLLSGTIDPRVVTLMSTLSERWHLGVQVLRAGHPDHVFGTGRTSNHTKGRAVDIWSLDGIPVIAHDEAPWRSVMKAAVAEGSDEVGGPEDIGGPGPPYFSDRVHQDHLHLGFEY